MDSRNITGDLQSIVKFDTNSSFYLKQHTTGNVKLLFFKDFFAGTDKIFNLTGRLPTSVSVSEV